MPDTDNLEEGRSLLSLAFINNPQGLQDFQDEMVRNIVLTFEDSSGDSNKDNDNESIKKAKIEKCVYFEDGSFQSFYMCEKKI